MNNFLKYWFNGFERFLQKLDDKDRENILRECGKSCSDSYTKQIYIDEYKTSRSISDFLCKLKNKFPEIDFNVIKENEIIELTYNFCACDLVKNEYINNPLLCECSRQSLIYNWESVLGQDKIKVELLQSILDGSSCCKFIIYLNKEEL
ncbi:MAG: hypothetical protein LBB56_05870 [Chitinispirillales bacterium]|jgi:hypothetical protein|nr:hypothetical protein [Chitinispirillales bacterium]